MKIVLGSIFADATAYLSTYFKQVSSLRDLLETRGDELRLILVWGDSTDQTEEQLHRYAESARLDATIVERSHGQRVFPSVDDPRRYPLLAYVGNAILEELDGTEDALLFVDSDLEFSAETMVALLDDLKEPDCAAVSPCIWFAPTGLWYDTWGYRTVDGVNFRASIPPCSGWKRGLMPIGSSGACVAIRGDVLRKGLYFSESDCIRGLTASINEKGLGHLYLDTRVSVIHPRRPGD